MIDDIFYTIKRYIIKYEIYYRENLGMKGSINQVEYFKNCFRDIRLLDSYIQEEVWNVNG